MLSGVTLGLIAALCWGVSDFLARFSSRSVGSYRALYLSQFGGSAVLLLAWPLLPPQLHGAGWGAWGWALLCSVILTGAALAFFQAFKVGVLALIAPIMGSYGAVTAALAWLAGETIRRPVALGLLAALLGIVLISLPPRTERAAGAARLAPGVAWALGSALVFGLSFFLLGRYVTPTLGGVTPTWLLRVVGLTMLSLAARPAGQTLRWPAGRVWVMPVGVGALSTLAVLATNLGLGRGQDAAVTVLGSLSVVITTLLALLILRERLFSWQWLGAALACGGVVLVGL